VVDRPQEGAHAVHPRAHPVRGQTHHHEPGGRVVQRAEVNHVLGHAAHGVELDASGDHHLAVHDLAEVFGIHLPVAVAETAVELLGGGLVGYVHAVGCDHAAAL